jgi:hypothetical protein
MKKNEPAEPTIRDTLFGDMPVYRWAVGDPKLEPWKSFRRYRAAQGPEAEAILRNILSSPDLESRHYLQAWHFLRGLGVRPAAGEAREVLGVVIEVALPQGLDLLAAYADRSARYYNYSGAAVVWERPDASLDREIDAALAAGRAVAGAIGLWEGERPGIPRKGSARLNVLTPAGLMFAEGPTRLLADDPIGGPLLAAATALMQALIAKTA